MEEMKDVKEMGWRKWSEKNRVKGVEWKNGAKERVWKRWVKEIGERNRVKEQKKYKYKEIKLVKIKHKEQKKKPKVKGKNIPLITKLEETEQKGHNKRNRTERTEWGKRKK